MALEVLGYGLDHVYLRDDNFNSSTSYRFASNIRGSEMYSYLGNNLLVQGGFEMYYHAYEGDGVFRYPIAELNNFNENGTLFSTEQSFYYWDATGIKMFSFVYEGEVYLKDVRVFQDRDKINMQADYVYVDGYDIDSLNGTVIRRYLDVNNSVVGNAVTFGVTGNNVSAHDYEDMTVAQGMGAKMAVYSFNSPGLRFYNMSNRAVETALDTRLRIKNLVQLDNSDGTYTVKYKVDGTGVLENSSGQFVERIGNEFVVSKSFDQFQMRAKTANKTGQYTFKPSFLNLAAQVTGYSTIENSIKLEVEYVSEYVSDVIVYGMSEALNFKRGDDIVLTDLFYNSVYTVYINFLDEFGNVMGFSEYEFETGEEQVDTLDVSVNAFDHTSVTFNVTKNFNDLVVTRNGYLVTLDVDGNGRYVDSMLNSDTEYVYVFSNADGDVTKQLTVRTSVAPIVKYLNVDVDTLGKTFIVIRVSKNFTDFVAAPLPASTTIIDATTSLLRFEGLIPDTEYDFEFRDVENKVDRVQLTVKTEEDVAIERKIRIKLLDLTDTSVRFGVSLLNLTEFEVYRNGVLADLTQIDDGVYEDDELAAETDYEYEFINTEFNVIVTTSVRTEEVGSGSEAVDVGYWTAYVRKNLDKMVKDARLDGLVSAYELYISSLTNVSVKNFGADLKLCIVMLVEEAVNKESGLDSLGMGDVSYSFSAENNQMFWNIINRYRNTITINIYGGGGARR